MARGGGGGGGRSSSGGGSGRSSGGHRSSSSGRSRSSSSSRSYSSSSRGYSSGSHHRSRRYGSSRHSGGGYYDDPFVNKILVIVFALIVFSSIISSMFGGGSSSNMPLSSYARTKLELGYPYDYDCVKDEAYWLKSPTQVAKGLKAFYDKTGVQPYIVIRPYDATLKTDQDKAAFAEKYYDEHFPNDNVFLYMYFEEKDDYGDGYMHQVGGDKINTMMDGEAIDIFWAYIDSYWETDMESDELFVKVFEQTGDRITQKSKTVGDSVWIFAIIGLVVAVGIVGVIMYNKKIKAIKAQGEADQRILNADVRPIDNSSTDDTLNKYL